MSRYRNKRHHYYYYYLLKNFLKPQGQFDPERVIDLLVNEYMLRRLSSHRKVVLLVEFQKFFENERRFKE